MLNSGDSLYREASHPIGVMRKEWWQRLQVFDWQRFWQFLIVSGATSANSARVSARTIGQASIAPTNLESNGATSGGDLRAMIPMRILDLAGAQGILLGAPPA